MSAVLPYSLFPIVADQLLLAALWPFLQWLFFPRRRHPCAVDLLDLTGFARSAVVAEYFDFTFAGLNRVRIQRQLARWFVVALPQKENAHPVLTFDMPQRGVLSGFIWSCRAAQYWWGQQDPPSPVSYTFSTPPEYQVYRVCLEASKIRAPPDRTGAGPVYWRVGNILAALAVDRRQEFGRLAPSGLEAYDLIQ